MDRKPTLTLLPSHPELWQLQFPSAVIPFLRQTAAAHQLKVVCFLFLLPSDPPPRGNRLQPPTSLSANQASAGVVLNWSLPEPQRPPITGLVLQSRTAQGEWFDLDDDISANSSEIIVPGLHKVTSLSYGSLGD